MTSFRIKYIFSLIIEYIFPLTVIICSGLIIFNIEKRVRRFNEVQKNNKSTEITIQRSLLSKEESKELEKRVRRFNLEQQKLESKYDNNAVGYYWLGYSTRTLLMHHY